MNKRNILLLAAGIVILIVAAAFSMGMNTPEKKVEQLKQNIESKKESSGYNKCVERLEAREKAVDDCNGGSTDECTNKKLIATGYTDGLECVGSGLSDTEQICQNTERYNAEVNYVNECSDIYSQCRDSVFESEEFKDIKNISLVECMSLLDK